MSLQFCGVSRFSDFLIILQKKSSNYTQKLTLMSFPTKDERARCWASRDEYWQCLNEYAPKHSSTSGEKVPDVCQKLRKAFEGSCPGQWVKHFDRKRTYEQFKVRMEKGYDPLEEKLKTPKQPQS